MKENLLLTSSSTAPEGGGEGFIEEISNSDLVSYAQLASLSGISIGTLINEGAG